jgi:hypothetical protein
MGANQFVSEYVPDFSSYRDHDQRGGGLRWLTCQLKPSILKRGHVNDQTVRQNIWNSRIHNFRTVGRGCRTVQDLPLSTLSNRPCLS